jgi:hypothetical protein
MAAGTLPQTWPTGPTQVLGPGSLRSWAQGMGRVAVTGGLASQPRDVRSRDASSSVEN